jgi:hypothetical protein
MRISYAIILATAAVSFEGCKVEKAAGVTNEGKDKNKVAQLDGNNKLDGGGGAGLGPDGEDDDEENDDNQDVAVPELTPSKTKAAAVAKATKAVQTATKARDDAKAALVAPRNQLIEAMTAENAIPPLQPTADAQAFIAAVRDVGGPARTNEALRASFTALHEIGEDLPAPVTQAKEALVAAITDELGSDDGKITAGRQLIDGIKALAPVQFAISPAALALAQQLRGAQVADIHRLQGELLAAIPDRADIPQGELAPVTAMFQQVATLRGLIPDPMPDIAALRRALIGSFPAAGNGNIPAAVLAARGAIAANAADPATDFGPLLNAIGDNADPNEDEYAAVLVAYAPLRDAMDRLARITAARDALLDTLVPAAALPVPEAIIARVRGINLEGDGDIPAKIEALGHLRTAIGADLAALRAPHDQALARIAAYPGTTDAAKAICDGLIASLTPADQLHDAIRQYRGAIGEQGVSEGAREQAKQALIRAAIDVASVDPRVSSLVPTYRTYTTAKGLVTRMEQSLAAAQTDLAKLTKPTTTDANAATP